MFSRLFKSKFYKKSKSCVNSIRTRVEMIQRRRNAVQKFLKNDVAEFLRLGLDYNAYQRGAGLLMEYNKSSCYELIDKYAGSILNHLDDLSKQRDCPDECKEAIQTLIYAASRFADLPELRELRSLMIEKYGNSLQPYTSKEFVEKLKKDLPAKEMTIQLLHDIAAEFSLDWDSTALKQQIYRPPSLREERNKHEEWSKNTDGTKKGEEGRDFPSQGSRKDVVAIDESGEDDESSTSTDMSSQDGAKFSSSSLASVSEEDEAENKRPFSNGLVPPPYLKPKPNNDTNLQETTPIDQEKPKPRPKAKSVRTRRPSASAVHVHPKLPEFDDLATHLASMRERSNKHPS